VRQGTALFSAADPPGRHDGTPWPWISHQARNLAMKRGEEPARQILILDHDTRFVKEFGRVPEAEGVDVKRAGPRAAGDESLRWNGSLDGLG
jgi:hypothetical protein